ncbi:MAG TPA: Gfo/Idh/MocA family oxidoreductase [Candidatus Paceibacterota bacterium]|nr:Gfo/Idh/MocA family oxidoreductase [Candidatus Paceibacterota bacterium]HRT57914.1 Gfo/Idh/MocA family oxidoreductase [Candidatus Paceibacterota bacterium]
MKQSEHARRITRRHFLAASTLAVAAPTLIPASALGRGGQPPPSERITMGVLGWGMMGPGNTDAFLGQKDCQILAACDVDQKHLEAAVNRINKHYQNQDCKAYKDYRELMARKDLDTVMLALPDNWHALTAVEAARQKKDIYGEKPLARTIAEQQAIVKAVQANQRIWQTGSWQRSQAPFRKAAEIVRNGLIGKVKRVEVGLPAGHHDFAGTKNFMTPSDPPPELDYDFWIGPSQMEPYIKGRVHMNWRWNYNIGGGQLLDWIGHHCDIAHWGLDADNSGPSEVEGTGEFPPKDAVWNTCTKYRITCKYPNDVELVIAGGHPDIRGGTKWIGTDGWVWVDRGGFDASNTDWFAQIPPEKYQVKLYRSDSHHRNFLDCVKSRKPTITPVETAHHSAIPGHLGLIAMLVGRKIKWDVATETIIGDTEASKLLTRPYRAPWKLPA